MTWLNFITQHPYLWFAAFIIVALLFLLEFESVLRGIRRLSANEVSLAINRGAAAIDINEPADFMQGHILGVTHIPFSHWPEKISHLDKTKSTILIANQERQAFQAAKILQQQGIKEVGILADGLSSWKNANFPLVKKNR